MEGAGGGYREWRPSTVARHRANVAPVNERHVLALHRQRAHVPHAPPPALAWWKCLCAVNLWNPCSIDTRAVPVCLRGDHGGIMTLPRLVQAAGQPLNAGGPAWCHAEPAAAGTPAGRRYPGVEKPDRPLRRSIGTPLNWRWTVSGHGFYSPRASPPASQRHAEEAHLRPRYAASGQEGTVSAQPGPARLRAGRARSSEGCRARVRRSPCAVFNLEQERRLL